MTLDLYLFFPTKHFDDENQPTTKHQPLFAKTIKYHEKG